MVPSTDTTLKPSEVVRALTVCVEAKQPAIVWGQPGIGKSQIVKQLGATLGRKVMDIRASLLDPVDLRGIPTIREGKTFWASPSFLPDGSEPSIVLLDELNRAPVMTQNALFQLVLDRQLGEYTLPDNCEVLACCNRESDGGGVNRMPQALANRFAHLNMVADGDDWSRWAIGAGVEPALIAFLRFRPNLLCEFSKTDKAFPTPRSWEFVNRITQRKPGNGIELALYVGTVGQGAAIEYAAFLQMYRNLPNIDAILLNPTQAPVPTDLATMFAVSAALASRASVSNFGRVLAFMDRMPDEYGVFAVQDAIRRDSALQSVPDFTKWFLKHSDVLI